jgi:hypothetical protein
MFVLYIITFIYHQQITILLTHLFHRDSKF